MASASVSGLVSGLDTATIIDQLMAVEAQPQSKLKTSLSAAQSKLKNLQDLNGKLAALATQAKELGSAGAWRTLAVSSSSDAVSASATSGTAVGSFDVTVVAAATTHRLTFAASATSATHVTGRTNEVTLTRSGQSTTVETDGTLAGLVTALNGSGTGVQASTIRLDDGTERLVVQSAASGAAGAFTLVDADGADLLGGATVRAGQDAAITIGPDTVHSATNSFANVLSGVSLTVSPAAVGTTVQIDVATDDTAVRDKVTALVAAVNAALTTIDTLTSYNATTRTAGPLSGSAAARSLRSDLLQTVYPGDGSTLAAVGIQTTRTGQLVLDPDAFAAAYAADPAKVAATFGGTGTTPGFSQRVTEVAASASDAYTGSLTLAVTGQTTSIRQLQDNISSWDSRLELRRAALTRQFASLETALSQMNSQSQWLAGQISSLSSGS